ncbi:MAG: hypothetical protein FWE68_05990 [Defluviitaleaceae bacterium]|nr:hypothetical protein [Defluviitaleaceae bacterium]
MLKLFELKRMKNRGFSLVGTMVTLVLLCIISLSCIGILTSVLSAKSDIDLKLKDQVAIRQALLTVTGDIRKDPSEDGPLGPIAARYGVQNGMLIRTAGNWGALQGSALAKDIAEFNITVDDKIAEISIKSVNGQEVATKIHLRFYK